ncbi:hypothetical protein [Hyalangium rubrum]|uniref:Lipoprotein n=1 Tax=Hyalangium rubrum TaxID=3103134 RepID=A0ABU5HFT0_9BACT|nr:hypothetical protein [Hyalangium sp. s54d21]MDY7232308.1 hypothetical protein [Hyalangium sp. s54d21]
MALKTGIFSLALSALLLGSTAMAQDTQVNTQQNLTAAPEAQAFHGGHDQPSYYDGRDDHGRYDDRRDRHDRHDRHDRRDRRGRFEVHIHTGNCHHGPQPAPPQNEQGRYELRLTQQWVPGRYEQVWVPQDCRYRPRRAVTKCTGGYYDQRWVEGRYETVEQWVWVSAPWQRHSGSGWGAPASRWN